MTSPGPGWATLLARLPQPGPGRATIGLAIDTGPHGADLLRAAAALAGDFPGLGYLWHDDGASAEGGAAAARAMIERGVRLLIGHFNSASALAAAPLYARAGAVLLAPGATHPALTGAMPHCFRLCAHDLRQARLFAEELAATGERPVLITQRIPHGRSLGDAVESRLRTAGHTPLRIDAGHPADLPALPPGPVAVIGRHAFAAALLPRLASHPLVLLSDDCRTPKLLDAIAPGTADLRVAAIGGADDAMPGGGAYSRTSRAAIEILAGAVEMAGPDPVAVAETLRARHWPTCLGIVGFDAKGEPIGIDWHWLRIAPALAMEVN
ncbi:MAG: ABC transporter substrate-binding protein [Sphingomonas sp.]|uniref:ABC transporter substrate-binding protein n=1 Tax=Sphingomonas sp. TaxID=28214 RepID=UPI0025E93EF5|nr:ABC transporter substrate-binding protein [Sphingomonas sp.]MBQ1499777.1 ABC transporter substrate-binding protein [Sphingomonas sp.]